MLISYSDIISCLALFLAAVDLFLIIWDRRPRLRVSSEEEFYEQWNEDELVSVSSRLWIDIANLSPRRIWVSSISAEWRRHRCWWLPSRWYKVLLPDLQRWENEEKAPTSHFWIEPWGSAVLSTDPDELKIDIANHKPAGTIWYCIAVRDALGKWYRGKKTRLEVRRKNS